MLRQFSVRGLTDTETFSVVESPIVLHQQKQQTEGGASQHGRSRSVTPYESIDIDHMSMRYVMTWILGVPFGVVVLWYIVGHTACR